jgi:predicted RNase H-like HicB family nuclease
VNIDLEAPPMLQTFTLEYWVDEGWYVGRLKGVPGVFSQGKTLAELEENIAEAHRLMMEDEDVPATDALQTKQIEVDV